MRNKMFKDFDENFTNFIKIIETLLILIIIILSTIFVSAIAHTLWEVSFGVLGFHVSRDGFAIVASIGLCSMQLAQRNK